MSKETFFLLSMLTGSVCVCLGMLVGAYISRRRRE